MTKTLNRVVDIENKTWKNQLPNAEVFEWNILRNGTDWLT